MKLTSMLVGAHFHPPAKLFLEHLPAGARLSLRHDTENPYDENAVAVWIKPSEVPDSQRGELSVKLPGMGFDLIDLLASDEEIMLGHVAASGGKPLGKGLLVRADLVGNIEFLEAGLNGDATLAFDGAGLILVILDQSPVQVTAIEQEKVG